MQELQARKPKKRIQVPRMAASKQFGRYKKEERKEEHQPSHTPGKVEKLIEIYRKLCEGKIEKTDLQPELESLRPESKDLNGFGMIMANSEYKKNLVSFFLSQAINLLDEAEFHIDLPSMSLSAIEIRENVRATIHSNIIDLHASKNAKVEVFGDCRKIICEGADITVHGRVEKPGNGMNGGSQKIIDSSSSSFYFSRLGEQMKGGRLEFFGNWNGKVGFRMKGGHIVIHGDVFGCVGTFMKGGLVEIMGDLYIIYSKIGSQMGKNARVIVHGDVFYSLISDSAKGSIEIKGKARKKERFKNGKWVK